MTHKTPLVRIVQMVAVLTAVVFAAGLVSACSEPSAATPPPAPPVTVESGVTALTPSAPGQGEAEMSTDAAGDESSLPGSNANLLEVGGVVQALGMLRVYANADPNTPPLAEYMAGNRFTVLDPPGNILVYPVESGGVRWYRVRAEDGLVGWVMADEIEAVQTESPE